MNNDYICLSDILAYENGELEDEKVVDLFQRLINTGMAWRLQGHYGRQAVAFLESGLCNPSPGGMYGR